MQRRMFLGGAVALAATGARALSPGLKGEIAALEKQTGGRIGLAVLDTRSDSLFWWRGDDRFPMCSTFKLLLVAHILQQIDRGGDRLEHLLPIGSADILDHAPFAKTRVGGSATIAELARAAITLSDNTAANLLLGASGGPAGLTAFIRSLGDQRTRLDRTEPTLNEAKPGDPRDTTTPIAMLALMNKLLIGGALSEAHRALLLGWMAASETGATKLRAGLPVGWRAADKTGAGGHGSDNDVALLWPPNAKPLLVASYLTGSSRSHEELAAVHARIGKLISATA